MPKLEAELVMAPKTVALQVEVEPALNVLNSLVMLSQVDQFSGLGEWTNETAAKMDPSNWERHRVIVEGLYFSVIPQHSYDSFEVFVADLAKSDPVELRDKVLNAYCLCHTSSEEYERYQKNNWEAVLHSEDAFIEFMHTLFEQDEIDENIERAAYNYLVDPPALREAVVSHLRFMWKEYMAEEIGVDDGEMICLSKGLHLYEYAWDLGKMVARLV